MRHIVINSWELIKGMLSAGVNLVSKDGITVGVVTEHDNFIPQIVFLQIFVQLRIVVDTVGIVRLTNVIRLVQWDNVLQAELALEPPLVSRGRKSDDDVVKGPAHYVSDGGVLGRLKRRYFHHDGKKEEITMILECVLFYVSTFENVLDEKKRILSTDKTQTLD